MTAARAPSCRNRTSISSTEPLTSTTDGSANLDGLRIGVDLLAGLDAQGNDDAVERRAQSGAFEIGNGCLEGRLRRYHLGPSELDVELVDGVVLPESRLGIRQGLKCEVHRGLLYEHIDRVGVLEQGGEGLLGIGQLGLGELDLAVGKSKVKLRGLHQLRQ